MKNHQGTETSSFGTNQLLSFKDDIILDPFIGSGTTAVSALKNNCEFVGYETNARYVALAENRIIVYLQQTKLEFIENKENEKN